jgi:uncharacterized protein (DUF2141 family)
MRESTTRFARWTRRLGLLLPVLALCASTQTGYAQETGTLTVEVNGLRSKNGTVKAAVFKDGKNFPGPDWSTTVQQQQATYSADGTSATVVFKDLPAGKYAVSVIHDEDGNGKLNKNFVGKPTEGYGASNNPKKRMGAPPFEEAVFAFDKTTAPLKVTLIY